MIPPRALASFALVALVACGLDHPGGDAASANTNDDARVRDAFAVRDAVADHVAVAEAGFDVAVPRDGVAVPDVTVEHDASVPGLDARDAGAVADAIVTRDVTVAPPDVIEPRDVMVAPPDVTSVRDVIVLAPSDVADVRVVDVVTPPPDVAPACGSAGQACCTGSVCAAGYQCLDWGGGSHACSACGARGSRCCPGDTCAQGRCTSYAGLKVCVDSHAPDEQAGGSCDDTGVACDHDPDTRCVDDNSHDSWCVSCGHAGQSCCLGTCAAGSTCTHATNGYGVCR